MRTTSGVVGKKYGMSVPKSATLHLCPMQLQAVLVVHTLWLVRFLFDYYRLSRRGGVTCDADFWVHHPANQEPTTPPTVTHDNGSDTALVVGTPARPKKQRKVRSQADTSVTTTTRTTRFARLKRPPCAKDGGYLSKGDSTTRGTQRTTPPHCAVLKARVSKRSFAARERCLRQGLHQKPWMGVPTPSMWTSVIPRCHQSPIGGGVSFCFFRRTAIVPPVHWFILGAAVEPTIHVYLPDTKGSDLCMRPLVQQLRDKGIPLTAKPLSFQRLDGQPGPAVTNSEVCCSNCCRRTPVPIWASSLPNECH